MVWKHHAKQLLFGNESTYYSSIVKKKVLDHTRCGHLSSFPRSCETLSQRLPARPLAASALNSPAMPSKTKHSRHEGPISALLHIFNARREKNSLRTRRRYGAEWRARLQYRETRTVWGFWQQRPLSKLFYGREQQLLRATWCEQRKAWGWGRAGFGVSRVVWLACSGRTTAKSTKNSDEIESRSRRNRRRRVNIDIPPLRTLLSLALCTINGQLIKRHLHTTTPYNHNGLHARSDAKKSTPLSLLASLRHGRRSTQRFTLTRKAPQ